MKKLIEIINKKNYIMICLFVILFLITGCNTKSQNITKNNIDIQTISTNNNLNNNQNNDMSKELNKVTTIDITKNNINKTNLDINIISFKSDKTTYSSREDIHFTLELKSLNDLTNVSINILGIKPFNNYYLQIKNTINIKEGYNVFTFQGKTPSCTSGCGGVNPGTYKINIELLLNDLLITNDEITIDLTK
jgi:hypothetical protein